MKKLILILAVIACALSATAQDSLYIKQKDGSISSYAIANVDSIFFTRKATTVTGYVVINGVKWATRNVNTPGTFATNPEDAGMFYQWNSKVGWPSTGAIGSITATDGSTTWNGIWRGGYSSPAATDTWVTANDPSPAGWRVPTSAEIQTLVDATKVTAIWTTQNSVYGEKFTDKATGNSIFLPASSYRDDSDGSLGPNSSGGCWSSEAKNAYNEAYNLGFHVIDGAGLYSAYRSLGNPVRPVAK
jgi:uncharacterized protein (TIGR02145 family)